MQTAWMNEWMSSKMWLCMKFTCSHMWSRAVGSHQESEEIQTNRFHWKKVCCCCCDVLLLENKIQQMFRTKKTYWMWSTMMLLSWQIQHTGAISSGRFHGIIWIFCLYGLWSTSDPLTSLCGSVVFVAVHWQILSELHVLLSFDGRAFAGPRQSL